MNNGKCIGTIEGFSGNWGSGLAFLYVGHTIEGMPGKQVDGIPCENAATVRALDAIFGGVIHPDHTASVAHLAGRPIEYSVDDCGVLLTLRPLDSDDLT